MPNKQVEGDSVQRRRAAREAREAGVAPSAAGVTTGASKQRHHLTDAASRDDRAETVRQGKLPSVGQGEPGRRPGGGRPEQQPTGRR